MTLSKEISELLPYSDGGFRRRLVSGLVFIFVILLCSYFTKAKVLSEDLYLPKETNFSAHFIFLILTVCYISGVVLCQFSDNFISKGASNSLRFLNILFELISPNSWYRKCHVVTVGLIYFFFHPVFIFAFTVLSSFSINFLYRINFGEDHVTKMSDEAKSFFDSQPEAIKLGFEVPFSDQYMALGEMLFDKSNMELNKYSKNLFSSVKDQMAIISAMGMAIVVFFIVSEGNSFTDAVSIYFFLCLVCWWLFGALSTLRSKLVSIIEVMALDR